MLKADNRSLGKCSVSDQFPEGPFGCILADPPWAFESYSGEARAPSHGSAKTSPYGVTTTLDLMALPVEAAAAKDCALFMWVIDSHVEQAMALGRAWGFEFKTCAFVWVKSKPGGWAVPGMGYWTRKQTEQCWLFKRGSPRRQSMGVEQIIHCPRGAHSAKPDLTYERIEALVGGPYLEMFARSERPGWTAWGNEVGGRDGPLERAWR